MCSTCQIYNIYNIKYARAKYTIYIIYKHVQHVPHIQTGAHSPASFPLPPQKRQSGRCWESAQPERLRQIPMPRPRLPHTHALPLCFADRMVVVALWFGARGYNGNGTCGGGVTAFCLWNGWGMKRGRAPVRGFCPWSSFGALAFA